MKIWKIIVCMLILFLWVLPIQGHAEEALCGPDATWHFEDGTLTISGTGKVILTPWQDLPIKHLVVEEGITDLPRNAFQNCSQLSTATLPGTLTNISENTFYNCRNLTSVRLSEGLISIGSYAFYNTNLRSITIPDTVTTIDSSAFSACSYLRTVHFSSQLEVIGEFAFDECEQLTQIQLPDSLREIHRYAFSQCASLEEIALPPLVTTLQEGLFAGCRNLRSITLSPNTVTIDMGVFTGCEKLKSLTIPPTVEFLSISYSNLEEIHISDLAAWCTMELYDYSNEGLSNIAIYHNGQLLTDLVVPAGLTYIHAFAFYQYSYLESVVLPEGVMFIGTSAFRGCKKLTTVTLPRSLRNVGDYAISDCPRLQTVIFNGTRDQIQDLKIHKQSNQELLNAQWILGDYGMGDAAAHGMLLGSLILLLLQLGTSITCLVIFLYQKSHPYG